MDIVMTAPNTLSMLWQIPQYIIITSGEVMLNVTALSMAFTEVNL